MKPVVASITFQSIRTMPTTLTQALRKTLCVIPFSLTPLYALLYALYMYLHQARTSASMNAERCDQLTTLTRFPRTHCFMI
jgi:hypothetical protein